MNNVESISNDVKRNIDINNSRANILVDELTLAQSELMSLQIKLNWIKNNADAVVCFGLLGLLVWVGVYFIGIEKTRAMLLFIYHDGTRCDQT